jgi:hypothetical protein
MTRIAGSVPKLLIIGVGQASNIEPLARAPALGERMYTVRSDVTARRYKS